MKCLCYDKNLNQILFGQSCIDGSTLNTDELQEIVRSLASTLGWEKLVSEWYLFLRDYIKTRLDAFNFATWLVIYDFDKCEIKNPYSFLALLYKKMQLDLNIVDDLNNRFDTPYDRFLDIYTNVLISSHIMDADDMDFAIPEKDEKFLKELKKIKVS